MTCPKCSALIRATGGRVDLRDTCSSQEMLGANTVEQLAQAENILRQKN